MKKKYDIDELKKQIIDSYYEAEIGIRNNRLMSPEQLKQKISLDVESALSALNETFTKGFNSLYEAYQKQKGAGGPTIDFLELDNLITSKDNGQIEISSSYIDKLQNISLENIGNAHNLLEDLIKENKFEEARAALYLLVNISPDFPPLLSSLGFVEYSLGNKDAAILAYTAQAVLDPEDPLPLIHGAYCLKDNNSPQEALEYINKALEIISNNNEFDDLRSSAEELKGSLRMAA